MKPFVVSIDGGGVRGLLALQAVKYLESKIGPVAKRANFLAGTSTGSIIALGLAGPVPLSSRDLEGWYQTYTATIFDSRLVALDGLLGPEYRVGGLELTLQKAFGRKATVDGFAPVALGDCTVPALAMAYDLQARLPVMLTSYGVHAGMPLWQACRASSAGPTFFEPYRGMADGGVCNNSPALTAVIEAAKLYECNIDDCFVLSIGTGSCEDPIDPKQAAGWGKMGWVQPVLSMSMDGASDLAHMQMTDLMPDGQYLRLQCRLSGPIADMDNVKPKNLLALRQRGTQLVAENLAQLDAFIARLEPK